MSEPGAGKAYVQGAPGSKVFVARRDYQAMQVKGWVSVDDYVEVPGDRLVFEVDPVRLTRRFIGLVSRTSNIPHLLKRDVKAKRKRKEAGRLVRPQDLVDLNEIVRRTGRAKSSITTHWYELPDFPKPLVVVGNNTKVWAWDEIVEFIQAQGWPLDRTEWLSQFPETERHEIRYGKAASRTIRQSRRFSRKGDKGRV